MDNPLDALEALEREATPGPFRAEIGADGVSRVNGERTEVRAQSGSVARTDRQSLSGRMHHSIAEQEANARILATGRNILPEVIALARATDGVIGAIDIIDSGMTVVPFGQERLFFDEAVARQRAALDALLRAISVEVKR